MSSEKKIPVISLGIYRLLKKESISSLNKKCFIYRVHVNIDGNQELKILSLPFSYGMKSIEDILKEMETG
jgi:hypothetical protein